MTKVVEYLAAPLGHAFMQRALVVAVLSGVACGVVGVYVVLRGMAFIGHAVSHAVFPGVAIAFVLQVNLAVGGVVAGLLTSAAIALFGQRRRVSEDTIIGVFFAAAFALGVVVISTAPGYGGSLESFLFGQILGIGDGDVRMVGFGTVCVLAAVALLHRHLVAVSLDRETAQASGLPVLSLDLAVYAMVTVTVVIALQAVGTVLVLALLITPPASARLLTDRIGLMMMLSPAIGVASSTVGLYASYALGLAAGGTIVLVATGVFVLTWIAAPKHGLIAQWRQPPRTPGLPA